MDFEELIFEDTKYRRGCDNVWEMWSNSRNIWVLMRDAVRAKELDDQLEDKFDFKGSGKMSDILIKDYTGEQVLMLIEKDRKRKRGCNHCKKGDVIQEDLDPYDDFNYSVKLERNYLNVNTSFIGRNNGVYIYIKYCPICGRKI